MFQLYQKFSQKYPEWKFGYKPDEDGLIMHLSVSNTAFTRVRNKQLAAGLPLKEYAQAYVTMIAELKAG